MTIFCSVWVRGMLDDFLLNSCKRNVRRFSAEFSKAECSSISAEFLSTECLSILCSVTVGGMFVDFGLSFVGVMLLDFLLISCRRNVRRFSAEFL